MYMGDGGIGLLYSEQVHECPVCGYQEHRYSCSCTTVTVSNRRSSVGEIKCYQKLYGDLVTCVDHYKENYGQGTFEESSGIDQEGTDEPQVQQPKAEHHGEEESDEKGSA